MKKLSTGSDSTLGNYRKLAMALNVDRVDSKGVKFFDEKIKNSPKGENTEVLADESQMLVLLMELLKLDIEDKLFETCPYCGNKLREVNNHEDTT